MRPARSWPNTLATHCFRCGGKVAAGTGRETVVFVPGIRWDAACGQPPWTLVEHWTCFEHAEKVDFDSHILLNPDPTLARRDA